MIEIDENNPPVSKEVDLEGLRQIFIDALSMMEADELRQRWHFISKTLVNSYEIDIKRLSTPQRDLDQFKVTQYHPAKK